MRRPTTPPPRGILASGRDHRRHGVVLCYLPPCLPILLFLLPNRAAAYDRSAWSHNARCVGWRPATAGARLTPAQLRMTTALPPTVIAPGCTRLAASASLL